MTSPGDTQDAAEKVVQRRMKLRAWWLNQANPDNDKAPILGSGPLNRHGMPRLPQGQHEARNWPTLDLGIQPEIRRDDWQLQLFGLCEYPLTLRWSDFIALQQVEDTSDFHCVTSWSKFDMHWSGVRFSDLAAAAGATEEAKFVMCHAYDGYTTNLPMAEAMKDDVLIVHSVNGEALPVEHGGPVRMITPQLYAWKGAKWISGIEFLADDKPGFWEQRGYSNTARPWREERYSR